MHSKWLTWKLKSIRCAWTCWLTILLQVAFGSALLASQHHRRTPVILISVDTLRADHLSSYGYKRIHTPEIDSLASGGTLFTQIESQVPLTLPSHVSLLTSTYPFSNRVEDNGEILAPNAITLATVLKSQGYSTAAFIGGFALDRRFGLDQGFDLYDSPFDLGQQNAIDPSDLKRPGEDVVRSAETWLNKNATGPFFLLLHLYDLHTPYQHHRNMPALSAGSGYDSELQYEDRTVGQFLHFLRERGLFDKALIVFVSDHGESLGEHGEATHGYFIYQSTLHVPLIIHWPAKTAVFQARVNEPSGLLDVVPTILQFLGVSVPSHFQGKSQLELLNASGPQHPQAIYSESIYAHNHYDCSPLRSVRIGRYKFIQAPKPELYDLDRDPHELNNLYSNRRAVAALLQARLDSLLVHHPAIHVSTANAISPKAAEQLRALGYMASSGPAPANSNSGIDPKDRIVQYEETHRAISMAYSGRLKESVALLEKVLATTPNLPDARNILGLFQQKLGLHEEAVKNFREILKKDPSNTLAHYNLAVSYFNLSQPELAIKEIHAVRASASDSGRALEQVTIPAEELLGTIWLQQKDYPRARTQFEHLLTIAPRDFTALYNLGWLAGMEGNFAEGIQRLKAAAEVEPENADAHSALGTLYLRRGDLSDAKNQFLDAARLSPASASTHYNLGVVLARENSSQQAASEFRKALRAQPNFLQAREALDRLETR